MPTTKLDNSTLGTVSPTEAAWLTELSAKVINAAIDRGELGGVVRGRRMRRLGTADVVYLALRKELADVLSAPAKRQLYQRLVEKCGSRRLGFLPKYGSGGDLEIALAGGIILIEAKDSLRRLWKRWRALDRAAAVVVSDPDIRGGEPVVRGTRVPVYALAELVRQGAAVKEILDDYPSLSATSIGSALAYAETHPRRGRPRSAPWRV